VDHENNKLLKAVAKGCLVLVVIIAACRFSKGVATAALAAMAIFASLSGRVAYALTSYALFAFMIVMSHFLLPKVFLTALTLRVAPIGIAIGLIMSSMRKKGDHGFPIGVLWAYLFVACISSATGFCPMVSYLKIFNFAVLLLGLHLGLRNINQYSRELERARMFMLSLVFFLIVGSVATLPFPAIAYSTSLLHGIEELGFDAANQAVVAQEGVLLFAGLTNQSQVLGILLPCALAWLLCDMLFVERRITLVHSVAIFAVFPLLYMCRSRTAFVAGSAAVFIVCVYCLKRMSLPQRVRMALRKAVWTGGVAVFCAAAVMEVRNSSITKFLRKSESVVDDRSFTEAFTESRMGKLDENVADFRENPLFGMGFQVMRHMKYSMKGKGFVFSAPIEKSILPIMVLGETGIIGGFVFLVFLIVFYSTCIRKRYFCSLSMMTVFLATNMSEATFFSPGGVGGVIWIFCGVGGFVNDMIIYNRRRFEQMPFDVYRGVR